MPPLFKSKKKTEASNGRWDNHNVYPVPPENRSDVADEHDTDDDGLDEISADLPPHSTLLAKSYAVKPADSEVDEEDQGDAYVRPFPKKRLSASSTRSTTSLSVDIDSDLHARMRIYAFKEKKHLTTLVQEWILLHCAE